MKYRQLSGKENRLSFGSYPEVSLGDARLKRAEARALLAQEVDPGRARDEQARLARQAAGRTFEVVAREWHATFYDTWQPRTAANILHRLEMDVPRPIRYACPISYLVRSLPPRGGLREIGLACLRFRSDVTAKFEQEQSAGAYPGIYFRFLTHSVQLMSSLVPSLLKI